MTDKPRAIFIMGPTASGKTDLAMRLYDELPCEIISVDSVLIYRGLDIGSAKPNPNELKHYPHHLIDILEPNQAYSVADFRQDSLQLMQEITKRGKTPLLVGGTMMYFNILLNGISQVPQADDVIRQTIGEEAEKYGWEAMHQQLRHIDPLSAERIHPNDPQRIQRALEVYRSSGKTMSYWREIEQQQKQSFPFDTLQFALAPEDRAILHQRIAKRFDLMLEQGFQQEVESLIARGDLHADMPSMRAVGYRQMWQHLHGEFDFDTMREKGIAATRQLAKRQLTWLRSWSSLHWLHSTAEDEKQSKNQLIDRYFQQALKKIQQL